MQSCQSIFYAILGATFISVQVVNMLQKKQVQCAMMAYGTSSAGKTYTIEVRQLASQRISDCWDLSLRMSLPHVWLQGSKADPGVLPRAFQTIFAVNSKMAF